MPKRTKQPEKPKRPRDVNQWAAKMVQLSTGSEPVPSPTESAVTAEEIRRVMSVLGKKGGQVSGSRRMENLSDEQRSRIAYKAAKARWSKKGRSKASPLKSTN